MRVMLASTAEKGHLNPMVGVAQRLLRDGHEVGWLTVPEPLPRLSELGVQPLEMDGAPPPPALATGGEELARLVGDAAALQGWIRTLLLDAVPAQVEPVRRVLRRFRPHVVALDGMLYQAVIAAHLEGVRYAGVSSALTLLEPSRLDCELFRTVRALSAERAALFERYGLSPRFRTCECLSPWLNLVFATEALVGEDAEVPPQTHLVGPSLPLGRRGDEPDFPWSRLRADAPVVYVSFGSQIWWQPELLALAAEAAAPLGAQVVMSAGGLADTDFARALPGHVVAVGYAPQLELLARASALVSHGGANSVMEAMAHGVPAVLLPICNDQPVQAWFLGRAGAGLSLDPRQVDARSLRGALEAVLDPHGPYRRHALRVRESYAGRDGAAEAARRITALAA